MKSRDNSRIPMLAVLWLALTGVAALPSGANATTYSRTPYPPVADFGSKPATPWMAPQAIELVTNGGFEGGPAGWTIVDQVLGNGSWFISGVTTGPVSGLPIPAPAQGSTQAFSDQSGPGSHILYQDVTIPSMSTATLNLVLWYHNWAEAFYNPSPATLDYNIAPNQQFRIDIMDPTASLSDVGAGVLLNVYQSKPNDPPVLGYTVITANLDAFAGQVIRLRFAEVDNQLFFNVGVDAVSIEAQPIVPVASRSWGALKHRYR